MKKLVIASICVPLICLTSHAYAGTISTDGIGNDTLATALNIDSHFSTGANQDIYNSEVLAWVSIEASGNGTYDYFSFSTAESTDIYLDIDYGKNQGGSVDTELAIWASVLGENNYVLLHELDDGNDGQFWNQELDSGTSHRWDPSFSYSLGYAADIIIGVAEYPASANNSGWTGGTVDSGDTYTLQISGGTPVPEPTTALLFGAGILGLAGIGRKSRK